MAERAKRPIWRSCHSRSSERPRRRSALGRRAGPSARHRRGRPSGDHAGRRPSGGARGPCGRPGCSRRRLVPREAGVLRLQRVAWGEDRRSTLRAGTWCHASRRWATATPIALDRNPGDLHHSNPDKRRAAFVEAAACVADSVQRIGLPAPVEIDVLRSCVLPGTAKPRAYPRFPVTGQRLQLRSRRTLSATSWSIPSRSLRPGLASCPAVVHGSLSRSQRCVADGARPQARRVLPGPRRVDGLCRCSNGAIFVCGTAVLEQRLYCLEVGRSVPLLALSRQSIRLRSGHHEGDDVRRFARVELAE